MEKEIMYNTDKKQVTASTFPAQLSLKFGQIRFTPRIMLYSKAATKIETKHFENFKAGEYNFGLNSIGAKYQPPPGVIFSKK